MARPASAWIHANYGTIEFVGTYEFLECGARKFYLAHSIHIFVFESFQAAELEGWEKIR